MAALALPSTRTWAIAAPRFLQPLLNRPSWSIHCEPSSSSSSSVAHRSTSSPVVASATAFPSAIGSWVRNLLPSLEALLELFPPLVLVPKKKVSHRRKAIRNAPKQLVNKKNFEICRICRKVKLQHHLCQNCYSVIRAMWKKSSRIEIPKPNTDWYDLKAIEYKANAKKLAERKAAEKAEEARGKA